MNPAENPSVGESMNGAHRRRRLFSIGFLRFRISRQRLLDTIIDSVSCFVETFVYLIGPLLILLAVWIVGFLCFVFFTICLPMLQDKYAESAMRHIILGWHCACVVFCASNVLFNFAMCVVTKHVGPHYDKVVRELAVATDTAYPETPAQLAQYRHDFEDRMFLRIRRRQARAAGDLQRHETTFTTTTNGMTHRKGTAPTNTVTPPPRPATPPTQPIRRWMLMGPFEWGYCNDSHQPKPPRSHYDHVTKQLVLNLDHYCPWMFNAIGYFNYRYFVTFLLYIFIGMLYGLLITLEPFLLLQSEQYHLQAMTERRTGRKPIPRLQPMLPYRDERMLLTLAFTLCAAVGIAVAVLGGFHVYLTLTAQTTIEFHANLAHRKRAKANNTKWTNPYTLGSARANFEQIFGRRRGILGWLSYALPSRREPEFLPVPIPGYPGRMVSTASATDRIDWNTHIEWDGTHVSVGAGLNAV